MLARLIITTWENGIIDVEINNKKFAKNHVKLLPSGKAFKVNMGNINYKKDSREYLIRPYYRKKIKGVMTIFAEEEKSDQ